MYILHSSGQRHLLRQLLPTLRPRFLPEGTALAGVNARLQPSYLPCHPSLLDLSESLSQRLICRSRDVLAEAKESDDGNSSENKTVVLASAANALSPKKAKEIEYVNWVAPLTIVNNHRRFSGRSGFHTIMHVGPADVARHACCCVGRRRKRSERAGRVVVCRRMV
jgi:hypothetical protein